MTKLAGSTSRRITLGKVLHGTRIGVFYALTALLTVFLSFEVFAHLLVDTPVLTKWAAPHHIHALGHTVMTAILIPAVGSQLHPRLRHIVGMQLLLVVALGGMVVSFIALRGFNLLAFPSIDFPAFNFTLYSILGLLILAVHPERGQIFGHGRLNLKLGTLVLTGSIPVLAYAVAEVSKQFAAFEPIHITHWTLMAATSVVLILVAALGVIAAKAQRLPIWTAGLGVAALGLGSIVFPHEASTFGVIGGLMALLWGAAFIALAELGRSAVAPERQHIREARPRGGGS